MKRATASIVVVAMLLFTASAVQADVTEPMVRFLSASPATSMTVYHPFAPSGGESMDVGVFNVLVDLPDGEAAFAASAFCIDLKQSASTAWQPYGLHALEIAPSDGGSNYSPMGAYKANAIRELWGEHFDDINDDITGAAFQAAIWEIVYENSNLVAPIDAAAWDLTSGNLSIDNAAVASQANAWLSTIGDNQQTLEQSLAALTNYTSATTYQDLVFVIPGGDKPPVPEPVTMLTLAMGVSGLGVYIRRRTVA